jgi:hypothetical protein
LRKARSEGDRSLKPSLSRGGLGGDGVSEG